MSTAYLRGSEEYSRIELEPPSNRDSSYVERPIPRPTDTKFIALGGEQVSRPKCGKVRIPASRAFISYGVRPRYIHVL